MNLRHIEVFHAVYETGSVSAAARALNVSQPSVSKVLKHAESRIGFPLFQSVRGRLVPTNEAHILFREARELYNRVESLRETTKNLRRGDDGLLRLGVLPSIGLEIAPAAIAKFRRENPDVSVELQTLHNNDVLRSLYERQTDLTIGFDAPHHPRLREMVVGTGELVGLFRKEDLFNPPDRISLEAFKGHDLIRLTGAGVVGNLFSNELSVDAFGDATIFVQTYYVAAALVRHGAGVAVVDEFTARASQGNDLDFRPLTDEAEIKVYCVHLEDRPLSRTAEKFIEVLEAEIASSRFQPGK